MKSTTLYYREGSSDKVYQASIVPQNGLFLVNFCFGRRGSTLSTGTKTTTPVDIQSAAKIFDKLVREKKAKGYTEGADGTPYLSTAQEDRVSGILPQLLNPIEESEVDRYLDDPEWCLQEKFDGKRLLLKKDGNQITGINRKGLVIGIPANIRDQALSIATDFVMDGECIGDVYYVFDLLELHGANIRPLPYFQRLEQLSKLVQPLVLDCIKVVTTAYEPEQKHGFFEVLKQDNREGIVFKKLDALYSVGRPASGGSQLKHKFYATASFVVAGTNKSKRSVRLVLFDDVYQKEAGNVTIPPNHPIPTIGDVVEVRYLYAFRESGCVYQPVFLGRRDDVMPSDCTTKQLKFRRPDDDDADQ